MPWVIDLSSALLRSYLYMSTLAVVNADIESASIPVVSGRRCIAVNLQDINVISSKIFHYLRGGKLYIEVCLIACCFF